MTGAAGLNGSLNCDRRIKQGIVGAGNSADWFGTFDFMYEVATPWFRRPLWALYLTRIAQIATTFGSLEKKLIKKYFLKF